MQRALQDEIGVALNVGDVRRKISRINYHSIALMEMIKKRTITAGRLTSGS